MVVKYSTKRGENEKETKAIYTETPLGRWIVDDDVDF